MDGRARVGPLLRPRAHAAVWAHLTACTSWYGHMTVCAAMRVRWWLRVTEDVTVRGCNGEAVCQSERWGNCTKPYM